MKIEIYKEPETELKPEEVVRLRFVDQGDRVTLMVVDANGYVVSYGNLLDFRSNGLIYRCPCVNPAFGFALDKYGQVVIY